MLSKSFSLILHKHFSKQMEKNKELRQAWDFVEHTGTSIFLTGKAGTGKTTFLKTVKEHSSKRMIVVAPTGVAAINAGGVTIHSFFQLPFTPYIPGATIRDRFDFGKAKRRIIASLDMVVIDEISMVRADLLDAIDSVLRRYRNSTQPFGGVQLLMIGDLQQLTPVVRSQDEQVLEQYYDTPYFFGSKALRQTSYVTIQLTHVYRQQDESFINILNNVRDGKPTIADLDWLNTRFNPTFVPRAEEGYIRLTTHNRMADNYNEGELMKLGGKRFHFKAKVEGDFPESSYPADETLQLKLGAQVMFIKNDTSGKHRYYNGRIGHVVAIDEDNIQVKCPGDNEAIKVEPDAWENTKYEINPQNKTIEPQVQGTFTQYPLRLAWAITIHKSQGLTFEHAIIDAGLSFASGQVYVALSRCKSLEGLVLASRIDSSCIINDSRVTDYISHQRQAAEDSIRLLPQLKEAYYREQLLDMFNFNALHASEQMLHRTLIEFFHAYPRLSTYHRQVMESVKLKVVDVAYKWQNVIRNTPVSTNNEDCAAAMPNTSLTSEAFTMRVKRSADYFAATLKELIPSLLEKTKAVKGGNKKGMELLDERYKDFWLQYLSKEKTLDAMAEETFSVAKYMQIKQEAMLDAMDAVEPGSNRTKRKKRTTENPYDGNDVTNTATQTATKGSESRKNAQEAKQKTQSNKPRKEDTKRKSLIMLQQGMKAEQIAKVRGLALSTIYGHLAVFIKKGELTADKVIPADKVRAIRHAIAQLPEDAKADDILNICRKDITKAEIYLMLNGRG